MLPETSIVAYFADLEDPRQEKNRKHPLINIIAIAILGVIYIWTGLALVGR